MTGAESKTSRAYRVLILKLDNGYMVESHFPEVGNIVRSHYCSNLKGVTAELYKMFEGKSKMRKDQVEFLRGAGKETKKEKKDA